MAGRPSKYDPNMNEQVYKLCLLGATDKQIADFFNVSEATINNWKISEPEFLESLKKGKEDADYTVAESLFKRATGYKCITQKAFKVKDTQNGVGSKERIEVVEVEEAYPPDTTAAIFWLKNRKPDKWRDKQEIDQTNKSHHTVLYENVSKDPKYKDR